MRIHHLSRVCGLVGGALTPQVVPLLPSVGAGLASLRGLAVMAVLLLAVCCGATVSLNGSLWVEFYILTLEQGFGLLAPRTPLYSLKVLVEAGCGCLCL